MAWCTERTSHGDVSFNLDSELAKASDSVSTPGRKSIGLQKDGKTGGGKDLKRTEKKAVRDGAQAGAQELRSYGKSYGVVAWKQPSSDLQKDGKTVGGKDLKRTEKKAVRDGAQAGAQELRSYGKSYGVVAWKQPLAMTKVSSGQIGRGGGGAARSATVGHQHQWQQQQQRPTPQRIAEKKPSPLTGLSGNRKGSAVIVPGSSLGGCYAAGAAGIASRGAVRVRTKDNVQKTREDAKKKIEQAAREKEAKHRFVVRRSNSLRGGKDRRLCSPTPQRIAEKKPSPLTGLSGNRKGSAVIVPGSSLGGCYAAGAAGIASRGAVRVRTKDNVQKTREDAKKKIEQAAREKKVKHTFVVRRSNSLRGGKDRG